MIHWQECYPAVVFVHANPCLSPLAVVFEQASVNHLTLRTCTPLLSFLHYYTLLFDSLYCFPDSYLFFLKSLVKKISVDSRLFPVTFLSKYLTLCVCHRCIVDGNYGIDVHVLNTQTDEWYEFLTYCCLKNACQIRVSKPLKTKP